MNPFSSAVNQKLFLADVLIRLADPEHDNFGHIEMALSQAALFQMKCAYQLYLNEIASNYKVSNDVRIETVEQLSNALLAADKYPSEAAEIKNLLDENDTWLAGLFSAFERISEPHSLAFEDKSSIPVQNLGDDSLSGKSDAEKINLHQVQLFLANFREMLERHRGLMIEC